MIKLIRIPCFVQIIALCVTPLLANAQGADVDDLLSSWRQLAKSKDVVSAEQIFKEAMQEGQALRSNDPKLAARLYLVAAGYCRDLNHAEHPITLFKLAIEASPDDPHIRRVYGDYLIGYRGLNEQAWEQYQIARQLLQNDSSRGASKTKESLERSLQIFRRDAGDGIPVIQQGDLSVSFTGSTGYSYLKKDILDLSTSIVRVRRQNQIRFDNGNPRLSENQIIERLDRHVESMNFYAAAKLRSANPNFPSLEFYFDRIQVNDTQPYVGDLSVTADQVFQEYGLNLEKSFSIENNIVLESDLKVFNKTTRTNLLQSFSDVETGNSLLGPFAKDNLFLKEESVGVDLNAKTVFHRESASFTVNAGGSFESIDPNFYVAGDSLNTQRLSLRNSIYYGATDFNPDVTRFRGRRSSHQEFGLNRSHRINESDRAPMVDEENWSAYISIEELGLFAGKLDLYSTLRFRERSISTGLDEGNYSVYELQLLPIWVPIYDLYDNQFTTGWEHVTVGFPLELDLDEGPYNRFSAGIDIGGRYFQGYAIEPSIGIEYAYYTEFEQSDLGGFIKVTIK